jgi:Trk-type K+ transport system membrane component
VALRMRQSLAALEEQFRQDMEDEQVQSAQQRYHAVRRTRTRRRVKERKRSSMRFWVLVLSLVATAIAVTVAMFETLYYLLG